MPQCPLILDGNIAMHGVEDYFRTWHKELFTRDAKVLC